MPRKYTIADSAKKFIHDLYFNTRRRRIIKKEFLSVRKKLPLTFNPNYKPVTKEEYEGRDLNISAFLLAIKGLRLIKEAEKLHYMTTLRNCKFKLFKFPKTREIMIESSFYKVCEHRNKIKTLYFPKGLPENTQKHARMILGSYPLKKRKLVDSGRYRQKIENFGEFSFIFRGRIFNKKILLKQINGSNENLLARNIGIGRRRTAPFRSLWRRRV
ncbi:MAG: hypothetical protein Q8P89_02305 [bacterium]|nr:hypothetical protein [bacterium]